MTEKTQNNFENTLLWLEIEQRYLYGKLITKDNGSLDVKFPSMKSLAEEYRINVSTISNYFKSKQIDWQKERNSYLESIRESIYRDRYHKKSVFRKRNVSPIQAIMLDTIQKDIANIAKLTDIVTNHLEDLECKEQLNGFDIKNLDSSINVMQKKYKLLEDLKQKEEEWLTGEDESIEEILLSDSKKEELTTEENEAFKNDISVELEEIKKLKQQLMQLDMKTQ